MAQERRQFKKLRISLTDTCNMACTYCVPENQDLDIRSQLFPPLSIEQLTQIVAALHNELNLQKIRLTGGEPLLYPHVVHLVKELKQLGIDDIALTTNAFYLGKLAKRLKEAGLKSVNISLDAADGEAFIKMTRKNMLKETLHGIDKALEHGLKVKINSVILKGINNHQIIPLLNFGIQKSVPIRFMELMKMGYLHHQYSQYFFPQNMILETIEQEFSFTRKIRQQSSTSNYWKLDNNNYEFGIIANETEPFCSDCDRLRLDSYGKIYGCLSNPTGISILKPISNSLPIANELTLAMNQKQNIRFTGSKTSMKSIGG